MREVELICWREDRIFRPDPEKSPADGVELRQVEAGIGDLGEWKF